MSKVTVYQEKEYKTPSKKTTIAYLKNRIATDEKWAINALNVVFKKQTSTEQVMELTTDYNEVGFTAFDAKFLTSIAKASPSLSKKQKEFLRKLMPKYAAQIFNSLTAEKLNVLHGYVIRDVIIPKATKIQPELI